MIRDLLERPIEKRPTTLTFEGRILYLLDDAELVKAQLYEGTDVELTDDLAQHLRDQISTDEITPAYICFFYDETLGDFPYLGLRTTNLTTGETEYPIERSAVRNGGFVCSVAGKRRAARGHQGRRRREHRADLQRELSEPGRLDDQRLRHHRPHQGWRANPTRGVHRR
jgi:hypothetical protein